jgi:Cu-Zn family superoxide dismutase
MRIPIGFVPGAIASLGLLVACGTEGDAEQTASTVEAAQVAKRASTTLQDASGNNIGSVDFKTKGSAIEVRVSVTLPGTTESIHGFHVHANNNPANGDGCIADPTQPANTHFVSADGHFNPGSGTHGSHAGDMPAIFVMDGGSGEMRFLTDRFAVADLIGRAVILHQNPDNYGNVPVGAGVNEYTANSAAAVTLTLNTGNAGNRIGCGVIVEGGSGDDD